MRTATRGTSLRLTLAGVLLVAGLAGCTGTPRTSGAPPASEAPAPTASVTAPAPTPSVIEVTVDEAARALGSVEVPDGYRVDVRCPPRTAADRRLCGAPTSADVRWAASRTYQGARLAGASGLTAQVTLNVTRATAEDRAAAAYDTQLRPLQQHTGRYEIPVQRQGDAYSPGQRGEGTQTPLGPGDWQGVRLDERYVLVFDDGTTSRPVVGGAALERRGVYLVSISWTAAGERDEAALDDLPVRVAEALDAV